MLHEGENIVSATKTLLAPPRQIPLGVLCGAGAGALWGLVFLAPELVGTFTPMQLAVGRYLAYGVIACVLIAPRWPVLSRTVTRQDWQALFWLSLLGNILYYILLSMAVQLGGIALTSLIAGFLPVIVTVVGSREADAVSLKQLVPSLILCGAGMLCIGSQAILVATPAGSSITGLFCAFAALASWSAYVVWNSRCLGRLHHISGHEWNLLTGVVTGAQAVLLVPVAWLLTNIHHTAQGWERFISVSVGIAFLASICGNALWNRMSRLLPLTMVGQMILFETLFALLYGFLWEQRTPRPLEVMAFLLVVSSVLSCIAAHRKA
ncbi:putative membrane protein [Komagataeibacter diospyri]|uniref:Putative membrane protein n=1 Tax=Komagataeibacter diospyri TaxID=1932662 RepID=A0A4P5NQJ6_9PROT|nr:putative membrane protein [Komagataeibacter diospyri]